MLYKAKAKYKKDTIVFEVEVHSFGRERCMKEAIIKAKEIAKKVFDICYSTDIAVTIEEKEERKRKT